MKIKVCIIFILLMLVLAYPIKAFSGDKYTSKVYEVANKLIRANSLNKNSWTIKISTQHQTKLEKENTIILNKKLLKYFFNDKSAIAFILAHEMAHQTQMEEKKSGMLVGFINQKELETDRIGLMYVISAGFSSSGVKRVLKYIKTHEKESPYHPPAKERLEKIEEELELIDKEKLKKSGKHNIRHSAPLRYKTILKYGVNVPAEKYLYLY